MIYLRQTAGLAFRNIRRNTRRTFLSGSTIAIAAMVICFMFAFEYGIIKDMEDNIRDHVSGDIRIRNLQYSKNERISPIQFYINNTNEIIQKIESLENVDKALPSITTGAMIYRNDETLQSRVTGLDFQQTDFFSGRNNVLLSGRYPKPETSGVLLSEGLALKAGLKEGDKFTFIVKTASGGTNGITVSVDGIIHIGDSDFNGINFFIDWKTLSSILRMNGNALEILVSEKDGITSSQRNALLQSIRIIDPENLEAVEWNDVNLIVQMFQYVDVMFFFFALFFFVLASTVIFNTTMMSVLERKKEIGTLLALGLDAKPVSLIFLLESFFISSIASFVGIFFGFIGISIMHTYGFDIGAMGGNSMSGLNFSSYIYPSLNAGRYILVFLTGVITACMACIIPANLTFTIQPAEALRTEN